MTIIEQPKDRATWLESAIKEFINKSLENSLRNKENEKAWAEPLVEFLSGEDLLYQEYKEHIGSFYWTPLEIFTKTFSQVKKVSPDQFTVISWILPQTEATKADNRKETLYPSDRG
jgi:epoxyqueuosine reductase